MKLPLPRFEDLQFRIRNEMVHVQVSVSLLRYLDARVKVQGDCWIWTKATPQFSYMHPERGQTTLQIPTLIYKMYKGPLKHNTYLVRTCGDWKCICPDHLRASTREGKTRRRASRWIDSRPEMVGQELDPFEVSSMGLGSTLDPKRNSYRQV
jgi:hypothetical protein